ncbi:MAG: hypothetical protein ACK4IX_02180 [Candidatus Sericytochromatia bacterium]
MRTVIGFILTLSIIFFYWLGLSINHIVIISIFGASIFIGALIVVDGEDDSKSKYDDFGRKPKEIKK